MAVTRKKAGAVAAVLAVAGASFFLGGIVLYNSSTHRLSMSAGSSAYVTCTQNPTGLHVEPLKDPNRIGLVCDPVPTTPTTAPPTSTSSSSSSTTIPPSGCPLTIGGRTCWASTTGVPGWSEAQIVAGQSPLKHSTADRTITTDGTVISDEWIDGCIAIKARNVTITRTLIRTSRPCAGGNQQASPASVNTGNGDDLNLTITDSEIDAGNTTDNYDYQAVGAGGYTLSKVNLHGGPKIAYAGSNVLIEDSFIHDPSNATRTNHTEAINSDSGHNVTVRHSWVSSAVGNGSASTGGMFVGGSYGPPHDVTIVGNFFEGGNGTDLVIDPTGSRIIVTGNRLSPNTAYGNQFTYEMKLTNPGNVWTDNLNSETLQPVGP